MNVQQFLSESGRAFEVLEHPDTATAQEMAHAVHVSGHTVAKTVLLRAGDRHVLVVLPASRQVDLERVQTALGAAEVALTAEEEVARLFPDCERGAVPPFGSRYRVETVVDETLAGSERIVFEGNTHHEAIRMRFHDYAELERPHVAAVSQAG